jgi:hypothetical protein
MARGAFPDEHADETLDRVGRELVKGEEVKYLSLGHNLAWATAAATTSTTSPTTRAR